MVSPMVAVVFTSAHAGTAMYTIAKKRSDTANRFFIFVARILLPPKQAYYWTIYNPTKLWGFCPDLFQLRVFFGSRDK